MIAFALIMPSVVWGFVMRINPLQHDPAHLKVVNSSRKCCKYFDGIAQPMATIHSFGPFRPNRREILFRARTDVLGHAPLLCFGYFWTGGDTGLQKTRSRLRGRDLRLRQQILPVQSQHAPGFCGSSRRYDLD